MHKNKFSKHFKVKDLKALRTQQERGGIPHNPTAVGVPTIQKLKVDIDFLNH